MFVHHTAIVAEGFRFLREGEVVEFEPAETDRGIVASNVSGPDGAPLTRSQEDSRDSNRGEYFGGGQGHRE